MRTKDQRPADSADITRDAGNRCRWQKATGMMAPPPVPVWTEASWGPDEALEALEKWRDRVFISEPLFWVNVKNGLGTGPPGFLLLELECFLLSPALSSLLTSHCFSSPLNLHCRRRAFLSRFYKRTLSSMSRSKCEVKVTVSYQNWSWLKLNQAQVLIIMIKWCDI